MIDTIKIMHDQGKQYIPDVTTAKVPGIFRGRPIISEDKSVANSEICAVCPTGALSGEDKLSLDMGRCLFCGECARCFPKKISFTQDYKISSVKRENLIIKEGVDAPVDFGAEAIRKELKGLFSRSLKLRQVSAAGDNSCEWELGATSNVNFDMGRFGIEFVASPRHSDGVVVTGPVSENMSIALRKTFEAVPSPKLFVLCGTDAISGGIFADSPALDRSFIDETHVDLYIPGNPSHPLTIINALLMFRG
ncbi:MAG: NADH:ubiquinone oxidoreductase [Bacteroidales bacterium]|nr:NADH:ubiquinone oxidoreductase [Bacteroidales bacterium]